MKRAIFVFTVFSMSFILPGLLPLQAKPSTLNERLKQQLNTQVNVRSQQSITSDLYKDSFIITLARQGNVEKLASIIQENPNINLLNVKDETGNNLFHVAKNAGTIQKIATLIRERYGVQARQHISTLINSINKQGESPLLTQINQGHADTFTLLYSYTTLKAKNDEVERLLDRSNGMDPRIVAQNRAFLCREIRDKATVNGRTLLQAAQGQIPYNPHMASVAQFIEKEISCLVQN